MSKKQTKVGQNLKSKPFFSFEIFIEMPSTNVQFKMIAKRTSRVEMTHSLVVEAELSNEFSSLVDTYQRLKIHHRVNLILCIFLIMPATFFSHLAFLAIYMVLVGATLLYFTI